MNEAIVAGCGITGSIIARFLAQEQHRQVVLYERRGHIAGNLYDYVNENGILVQQYGPHIFHTSKEPVYSFVSRYAAWHPFKLECMVEMNGKSTPSPFNLQTIDDYFSLEKASEIKRNIATAYPGKDRATIVEMLNSNNRVVREYAQFLYDSDYSLYTAKQWGIPPSEIDTNVLRRVPVLFTYETGYFSDKYELMPQGGFTAFVQRILDHPGIHVCLETDVFDHITLNENRGIILHDGRPFTGPFVYTGMLDQLFGSDQGALPYRSLRFQWQTHTRDSYQAAPVVAYPQAEGFTRITEYKKLPVQPVEGRTTIAIEYPCPYDGEHESEPYYPIPTRQNQALYASYRRRADAIPNLILCGRLADYQYYNIDQAIEAALAVCGRLRSPKE